MNFKLYTVLYYLQRILINYCGTDCHNGRRSYLNSWFNRARILSWFWGAGFPRMNVKRNAIWDEHSQYLWYTWSSVWTVAFKKQRSLTGYKAFRENYYRSILEFRHSKVINKQLFDFPGCDLSRNLNSFEAGISFFRSDICNGYACEIEF